MPRMSFSPEIGLPAAHRREVQGPLTSTHYLLQWATHGRPPHPSIQTARCPRGDDRKLVVPYEGTTNLMGFTLSLANVGFFSSWASPSALERRRKCGCPTAARTLITPGPWNPQPMFYPTQRQRCWPLSPSPTSSLWHLGVLFKDNEPLNHCF